MDEVAEEEEEEEVVVPEAVAVAPDVRATNYHHQKLPKAANRFRKLF